MGSKSDQSGRETRRFLSALTPEGMVCFTETLQTLCPRLYAIEDDHGAASSLLMAERAVERWRRGCRSSPAPARCSRKSRRSIC